MDGPCDGVVMPRSYGAIHKSCQRRLCLTPKDNKQVMCVLLRNHFAVVLLVQKSTSIGMYPSWTSINHVNG